MIKYRPFSAKEDFAIAKSFSSKFFASDSTEVVSVVLTRKKATKYEKECIA